MRKTLKLLTVLVFALLVMPLSVVYSATDSVTFRYAPQKGSSSKYLMVIKTIAKVKGMDKEDPEAPLEGSMTANATFTERVNDIDDKGTVDVTITYDDVSLEVESLGQKASIPLGNRLGGKAMHIKVSGDGKVMDVKGLEDLPAEMKDIDPKKLFPQLNPYFPKTEIKVGDSWSQDISETTQVSEGVAFSEDSKLGYKLTGFEKKKGFECAVIEVSIVTNVKGGSEERETGLWMETSGKGTGVIYYAHKASKTVESALNMDFVGSISLGTGQKSTTKHHMDITMELIR
ncbi:MAG: hypothetical protein ABH868_01600 [bacterium]